MKNEQDTERFGMELARRLMPGDLVAMTGNLGAGKTTLTKAIAKGLGVKDMVTSPTFTILQEYQDGKLPFYHFDVYRIAGPEEMYELGYEDYFFDEGVCVVEWADRIDELLPPGTIHIEISYGDDPEERRYRVWGKGYFE